ncbi:MAG: HD domain-containing protein [Candidatus Magasanikbacteria bacterium]|nr:HD domain-containing protein [Candidatus Magasanikbacteria bacterium]
MDKKDLYNLNEKKLKDIISQLSVEKAEKIKQAFDFAISSHDCQFRKSGDPYIVHPIAIAIKLHNKYNDIQLTVAALLHDVVEDCEEVSREDIYNKFGREAGFIVDANTKRLIDFFEYPDKIFESKVERLLWAGRKDVRVLLLKIADRENNLKTINYLKHKKQVRMAFETQAIYRPLRRILKYDESVSVKKAQNLYEKYIKKNNLQSPQQAKRALINESFETFSEGMFGLIYGDTANIIWKISDFDTFKKICETDSLQGKIRFLSISGNRDWFNAAFQFKQGVVIDNVKLGISSYEGQ